VGLIDSMTFWLIIGINWSINFWFFRVAQTTCDNWTTVSSCTSEQGGDFQPLSYVIWCCGTKFECTFDIFCAYIVTFCDFVDDKGL
jgi:hypothetical protein